MKYSMTDFDVFYLSYDEPQKEEYWAKLQEIAPWAKRVDGVKGFDAAHKACAIQSETGRFITVDGDNLVYPEFFDLAITIPTELDRSVLSWAGKNIINGLTYGNGGLKLWTKEFVLNMRTHENAASDAEKLDFCWDNKYMQLNNCYSDTCPNGSPFQAFRAGFREGVKMSLDRGNKVDAAALQKRLHDINFKRLLIWATVGADVENGLWAIYGTRLGIYKANHDGDFDLSRISDYDWFKKMYYEEIAPRYESHIPDNVCSRTKQKWNSDSLGIDIFLLGQELNKLYGLDLAILDAQQSKFFKNVYTSPKRSHNPVATEVEMTHE